MASAPVERVLLGIAQMNDPSPGGKKDLQALVTDIGEALADLDDRLFALEQATP